MGFNVCQWLNFMGAKCIFQKFVGAMAPLAPTLTHPLIYLYLLDVCKRMSMTVNLSRLNPCLSQLYKNYLYKYVYRMYLPWKVFWQYVSKGEYSVLHLSMGCRVVLDLLSQLLLHILSVFQVSYSFFSLESVIWLKKSSFLHRMLREVIFLTFFCKIVWFWKSN